jgi:hypothetical protein
MFKPAKDMAWALFYLLRILQNVSLLAGSFLRGHICRTEPVMGL